MTVLASSIIDKAAKQLFDPNNLKWSRTELLGWLNDGMRQITMMQPTATNTLSRAQLVAGTRQTLPAGGWLLLNVYRNMGLDGATPGKAIRFVSRELLDGFNPDWHTATPSDVTKNYFYDLQDQTVFYVYPPSKGNNYVELNYSKQPTDIAESDPIPMFDIYEMPLLDYVLYRACLKPVDYAPGADKAQLYLASFTAAVGVKEQSETKATPEQSLLPRNPNMPGSIS